MRASDVYRPDAVAEDSEAVYIRMRRYLRDRNIEFDVSRDQIDLSETLGSGQFGSVCRATYRMDGEPPVTVAVKTLKIHSLGRHTSEQVIFSSNSQARSYRKNIGGNFGGIAFTNGTAGARRWKCQRHRAGWSRGGISPRQQ